MPAPSIRAFATPFVDGPFPTPRKADTMPHDQTYLQVEKIIEQARLDTNRPRIFTNKRIPAPSIRAFATPFVDGGSEQNIIR